MRYNNTIRFFLTSIVLSLAGTLFAEVPVPSNLSAEEAELFRQCMRGNQLVQDFYTHVTMRSEMVLQAGQPPTRVVEKQEYKSNSIDNLRVDRQNDTEQYAVKVIVNTTRYAAGEDNDEGGWYVTEHSKDRVEGTSLITIKRFPCAAFAFWLLPLQSQRFEIQNPASPRTDWAITSITKEKQEGLNVIVWKVTDKHQLTGQIVFLEDKQYAIKSYQVIARTPSGQKIDFTCEYEGEEIFQGEKIPLVKRCTYHHIIGPGSSHERVAEHRDWTITSIVSGEVALEEFDPEKVFGVKIVEPQMESRGHFIFRIVMASVGLLLILIWLYLHLRDKNKQRS